jgi:hypothetical protein
MPLFQWRSGPNEPSMRRDSVQGTQIRYEIPILSISFFLTHFFIVFESMCYGQEFHDTNRQAWLYHGTQGLPGLG